MKNILFVAILFFGALSSRAQEKVMNIQKTDGTSTQTRVADLNQISFLTVDEGGQGFQVKTLGGENATVLFETNPVVTVSNGKMIVKSSSVDAVEFEITDIAEILFRKASDDMAINELKDAGYLYSMDMFPSENFILNDETITFVYNPYEIAPYAVGSIELVITYNEVSQILNPSFKH